MPELPACYGKLHIASCVKENSAETLLYQKKEKKKEDTSQQRSELYRENMNLSSHNCVGRDQSEYQAI